PALVPGVSVRPPAARAVQLPCGWHSRRRRRQPANHPVRPAPGNRRLYSGEETLMSLSRMASISERENREILVANASGKTPVVFMHGLWLLPSSWASWADFFKQAGYAPLTPDWPDDPETVEQARAEPEFVANKTLEQVAHHTTQIIHALDHKPAVMG